MSRFFLSLYVSIAAGVLLAGAVHAGPVLDELLSYAVVDQKCPSTTVKDEGMGLACKGKAEFAVLSKDRPLGQTFKLSSKAVILWRLTAGICHWPDSWQEGENVTFTLWDSPAKSKKLYSRTLDYAHKWFKWDVAFDTHVPVEPNKEYYFELNMSGSGGDGKINVAYIAGDVYKRGQAYVAGRPQSEMDLYFVAIAKPKPDKKANMERFLSQFDYNYPPLAEAAKAYKRGELDKACDLILREFETRTQPDSLIPKPEPADELTMTLADQVCDEGRLYRHPDKKDFFIEMDSPTTWREVWPNSAAYVRPNDVFWRLGRAYQTTHDEKYARKLNELMTDFMQDYPSPFDGGMNGARWIAMHIAWRLGDAWDGFGPVLRSKGLTRDVRLAWLNYWCRMAYFAEHEHSGGNHANAVGQALMAFGHRFPEYKDSKEWQDFGFSKLMSNSLKLFRDDGGCREPAMNYHGFSLANLLSGLDMAKKYGYTPPKGISKLVEHALAYTAYMLEPNGHVPTIGDTDCDDFRPNAEVWDGWRNGEAMKAYRMFGRQDCLYIATAGKQGKRPQSNSYCFPQTGHYILRSDWGGENGKDFDQARWLLLRAGSFGSHGHWDLNEITLYAYGRPLLLDPGRTAYDSPLMPVLSSNKSHNVLLVDDQPMNRVEPTVNSWHTTPVMDLVDNSYKKLYENVDHRRAVIFVRPDYYVMFDKATAEEPHRIGINFWLTPPDPIIDRKTCTAESSDPDGANVLLRELNPEGVEIADRKGTLDLDGDRSDIPVVTFWQNGKTEAEFATLIYPYPKGAEPQITRSSRYVSSAGQACFISTSDGSDVILYTSEPQKVGSPIASMQGRAAVIRLGTKGEVRSFALIDGSSLKMGQKTLVKSTSPVDELSVNYLAGTVKVMCKKPGTSIEIASLGRKKAVLNGKEISISGESFRP